MGLLDKGQQEEKGWICHLRDDDKFIFRQLPIETGWLIDAKGGEEFAAYMQPYATQLYFPGYGKVPECLLTVTFPRDILYDPFNKVAMDQKPEKGPELKKSFMAEIANRTVYTNQKNAKPTSTADKMVLFLGSVIIILAICIGIQMALNQGG